MKILILCNYANGLYLFRSELIEAFIAKEYEVIASMPLDENVSKIEKLGVKVIPTKLDRRSSNPIKDFSLYHSYKNIIRDIAPDVVLTYTIKPNIYGCYSASRLKTPCIVNVTGLGTAIEDKGFLGKVLLLMYRVGIKNAHTVFFQNAGNMDYMKQHGIALNNAELLPGSGINLKAHPFSPYPSEKEGINALAVIRIMKDKGIEEYLDLVKNYADNDKIKFTLVGEYEEETRNIYEPMIKSLTEKGILNYLGHIDNVHEVMMQSHVIIHPSYHEGLSNVLLEAASCGRPVIATDVSGCKETFEEGVTGIGIKVKSSQALVEGFEKFLQLSEDKHMAMGLAGRNKIENEFSRQIIVDKYLDIIGSME